MSAKPADGFANYVSITYDDSPGIPHDARFEAKAWRWPSPAWARRLLGDDFFRRVVQVRGIYTGCSIALQHVKAFTQLQVIDLTHASVSDADLVHLSDLKQLRALYLHGTPITSEALVHVRNLRELRTLSLHGTNVDDRGMTHLEDLSKLTLLNIQSTRVSQERVEELRRALPACRIEISSSTSGR